MTQSRLLPRAGLALLAVMGSIALFGAAQSQTDRAHPVGKPLQDVGSFASIGDASRRSAALFAEAGKVLQHPRCLNCHPPTRRPTQGETLRTHMPPIFAGGGEGAGAGLPGLPCTTCHRASNTPTLSAGIVSVPGAEHWSLAPASMAWQGKSLKEICEQIKDPARNGGRSLAQIRTHLAEDHLVGWAWHPGDGREPAPGTQTGFGSLIEAWIATGAHCPAS